MPCLTMENTLYEIKTLKYELQNRTTNIEPCMNLNDLLEIETTYMLRFPVDYRMYLLEIGNGVEMLNGPCKEGILPFGKLPFGCPFGFLNILENLKKPFPYEEEHITESESVGDVSEHHAETNNFYRLAHNDVGGYLILGTSVRSNSHFWILICDGYCRGEVWIATISGSFFPCTPRMSFSDWLKDWLGSGGLKLELSLQNTKNYPLLSGSMQSTDEESYIDRAFFNPFSSPIRRHRTRRSAANSFNIPNNYND